MLFLALVYPSLVLPVSPAPVGEAPKIQISRRAGSPSAPTASIAPTPVKCSLPCTSTFSSRTKSSDVPPLPATCGLTHKVQSQRLCPPTSGPEHCNGDKRCSAPSPVKIRMSMSCLAEIPSHRKGQQGACFQLRVRNQTKKLREISTSEIVSI